MGIYISGQIINTILWCYIISIVASVMKCELILGKIKFSLFFAWYDHWIGGFWDSKKRIYYIVFMMAVLKIEKMDE